MLNMLQGHRNFLDMSSRIIADPQANYLYPLLLKVPCAIPVSEVYLFDYHMKLLGFTGLEGHYLPATQTLIMPSESI